jgi:hypothetical protein
LTCPRQPGPNRGHPSSLRGWAEGVDTCAI